MQSPMLASHKIAMHKNVFVRLSAMTILNVKRRIVQLVFANVKRLSISVRLTIQLVLQVAVSKTY
jgi:hypothetical protein